MYDNLPFEFDPLVMRHIGLFDEMLTRLGKTSIEQNVDFELEEENSGTYVAIFDVSSKTSSDSASMWLHLTADGIRLDIDGINELFEWSAKEIDRNRPKVIDFLGNIFTGYLLIETRGGMRFVEIFDSNGAFVDWTSYNDFFHMITRMHISRFDTDRRLFLPFYR